MNKIIISFCIPSYNRANQTIGLVRNILQYPNEDIEVIVVDNSSVDDTVNQLLNIKDKRLKTVVNSDNIGAMGNYVESLRFGKGVYSFVVLSRDGIINTQISELVDYLKEHDFSMLYCGEDKEDKPHVIFTNEYDALLHCAYHGFHQTGHIYKTEYIQAIISQIDSRDSYKLYGYFPHDFWNAELSLLGKVCFYNKRIRTRVDASYFNNSKSACREPSQNLWFFPDERIKQLKKYIIHMEQLNLGQDKSAHIFMMCYRIQLISATIEYKKRRSNIKECNHYSISLQNIKLSELIRITNRFKEEIVFYIRQYYPFLALKEKIFIKCSNLYVILRYVYYCINSYTEKIIEGTKK